jgi:hypothetical protein
MDFAHEDADYPEGAATATMEVDGNGDVEAMWKREARTK